MKKISKNSIKVTTILDFQSISLPKKDLKYIVEHRLLSFIYNYYVFGYDKSSVKYKWKKISENSKYELEMIFDTDLLRNPIYIINSNKYYLTTSISSRFLLGENKLYSIPMKIYVTNNI